jgi:hypothetical protein
MTARERSAFVDVVLDALIQLNARLPAPLVARYAEMRPVQSLALLTNSIERDPTLLDLFSRTSGTLWYGLANLLLQDRAPGFAGQLLKTLQLRLNLTVSDVGQGVGSGSGSLSVGDGIGENPAGYPPHAQYRFEIGPRTGVVILTTGPHTVYYSRTVSTAFQYGVSEVSEGGPSDDDRLAYLRAMLGPGWISGKTKR